MKKLLPIFNDRYDSVSMNKSGFTLLELLIVIAIASIVIGSVSRVLWTLNRSYTTERVKTMAQQKVRTGIEFMARHIQMAGLDPLGTANAGILSASANSVQLTADLNLDGDAPLNNSDPFEDLTFTYNNGANTVTITDDVAINSILIENVTNCTFSYFGVNGSQLTLPLVDLGEIRSIGISLTVSEVAGRDVSINRTLDTIVTCRNL